MSEVDSSVQIPFGEKDSRLPLSYRNLASAVINRALVDVGVKVEGFSESSASSVEERTAYRFFFSSSKKECSFYWWCKLVDIDPMIIRKEILNVRRKKTTR